MSFERELLGQLGRQAPPPEASEAAAARRQQVVARLRGLERELGQQTRRRRRFSLLAAAVGFAAATALGAPLVVEALRPVRQAPAALPLDRTTSPPARLAFESSPPAAVPAAAPERPSAAAVESAAPPAPSQLVQKPASPSSVLDASAKHEGRTSTLSLENELFARARAAGRRADYATALASLEELTRAYPRSPLQQDARVERFRVLSKMGRSAEAARAARRYLADFPRGYAREEAQRLAVP